MNTTLDNGYFEWLYAQIGAKSNRNPARSHWELAKQLYSKPFHWFIPNDDNRVEDARELRYEYFEDADIQEVDSHWVAMDASFLEMLIALSRRAAYESYGTPYLWFWKFMTNLNFADYTDNRYNERVSTIINDRLDIVNDRTYDPDGNGGIFPLVFPNEDQRKIEIRYQMAAYLLENTDIVDNP